MSEAKPAEKPAEEAPAAVAGDGGLKKLVVLLLVFVVLMFLGIIGGGVYLFVLKPPVPMVVPAAAAAHGGEHGEEGEEGAAHGEEGEEGEEGEGHGGQGGIVHGRKLVALPPLTANLQVNEGEEASFVRTTMSLEVAGEEQAHEIEESKIPIMATLLAYFRTLSIADTRGEGKSELISNEVKVRVNRLFGEGRPVKRVWISEFVVQQ